MAERLSILVPCKNRSFLVEESGGKPRLIFPFPNLVHSLRRGTLRNEERVVDMVVVDFHSDDWPLEKWLPHLMAPYRVKIVQLDGPFSVGRAWNEAVMHTDAQRLWFLDTDMLVRREVMNRGVDALRQGKAYFPICWSWDTHEHTTGEWRIYGTGNAFILRKHYEKLGPRPEFDTHGKSDEIIYKRFKNAGLAIREQCPGFYHQWHPNTLPWLNRYYAGEHVKEQEDAKWRHA